MTDTAPHRPLGELKVASLRGILYHAQRVGEPVTITTAADGIVGTVVNFYDGDDMEDAAVTLRGIQGEVTHWIALRHIVRISTY
ncbi:hypothetical protein LCL87_25015 [Rhodococcus hoagii]|nr:hypothetical protein [Prescottella equi]